MMTRKDKEEERSNDNISAFELMARALRTLPMELRRIETEADWANTLATFLPLLNSDPNLAIMFVSNPYGFCEDLSIELGEMLRDHLERRVAMFKYCDTRSLFKTKTW